MALLYFQSKLFCIHENQQGLSGSAEAFPPSLNKFVKAA